MAVFLVVFLMGRFVALFFAVLVFALTFFAFFAFFTFFAFARFDATGFVLVFPADDGDFRRSGVVVVDFVDFPRVDVDLEATREELDFLVFWLVLVIDSSSRQNVRGRIKPYRRFNYSHSRHEAKRGPCEYIFARENDA